MILRTSGDEARCQYQAFGLSTDGAAPAPDPPAELLITALFDEEAFPRLHFKQLYYMRRAVEGDTDRKNDGPRWRTSPGAWCTRSSRKSRQKC